MTDGIPFERMRESERRRAYAELVASLDPAGPPRLVWTHRPVRGEPRRVGVLAASFNPPTRAHLRMAILARERFRLDEVLFELAKSNVDKPIFGAPLHERLMMLRRIAERRPWLSVGASTHGRFLDKVSALRPLYPTAEIVFIVGYDTLVRLFDPKYYTEMDAELGRLFAEARFVCANRGEADTTAIAALMDRPETRPFRDGVAPFPLDPYHASLSASSIRERLAHGETTLPDVLPEVAEYIFDRALYRDPSAVTTG